MNKFTAIRGFQVIVMAALCAGLSQVRADDTEVFFPDVFSAAGVQNPNLLFMIDTSGSMACAQGVVIDSGGNICAADTDPQTRIERLKSALIQVIDDLPSAMNVGLGRFSGSSGGAILFPVAAIDANLSTVIGNRLNVDAYTTGLTGTEAEEDLLTNSVTMAPSLGTPAVRVGTYDPTTRVVDTPNPQTGLSLTVKVSDNFDEAEEWSNNTMETGAAATGSANRRCGIANTNAAVKGVFEFFRNPLTYNGSSGSNRDACLQRTDGTPGLQKIGLRFRNVQLPKVGGTVAGEPVTAITITGATLTFRVHTPMPTSPAPKAVHFVVRGEAADNSVVFSTTGASNRVSGRSGTSANVVGIIPATANPAAGVPYTLPNTGGSVALNLQTIISQIHAQSGWNTGNAMTLLIEDVCPLVGAASTCNTNEARRLFHSFLTGGNANAPTLSITYNLTTTSSQNVTDAHKMMTGLRFENVQIPRGANVVAAYLELRARGNQSTGLSPAIQLNVKAQTSGDSPTLEQTTADLSGRAKTTASASWTLPTSVSDQDSVISPDLSAVIEQVTDAGGWCGGNALTLFLDGSPNAGTSNGKRFSAYSNSEYVVIDSLSEDVVKDGPILHIELDATDPKLSGTTAGCSNGRAVNTIAINNDDAEQNLNGNAVSRTDNDLELGFDTDQNLVAVRFSDVRVPQGATILSASMDFTAVGASSGNAGLSISAINAGDTNPLLNTTSALSSLSPKTAVVDWSTAGGTLTDWADQGVYTTPDLTAAVQSVVSNGSWAEGNNMTFLVEAACPSGSCRRRAYSRDGRTSGAPKLRIQFSGSAIALTVRDELKRLVLDLPASGGTPSAPALYEAARYFRGEAAFYGRTRGAGQGNSTSGARRTNRISHVKTFTAASAQTTPIRASTCLGFNPGADDCTTEHWEGTTVYKTPILNACSSNNIIFFTDGSPNTLNDSTAQIRALPNPDLTTCLANAQSPGGNCVRDLAKFLHEEDQNTSLTGVQTVTTNTVLMGFAEGSPQDTWLDQVAANGGGKNYLGNNASELATAFQAIVSNILDINTTFVAPAVTVNTFNRLTNRNELYFALFNPAAQVKWEGNLKKFKLKAFSGVTKIVDVNDIEAVDSTTGFFKNTAQSIWSTIVDGATVEKGGAVGRLAAITDVYTMRKAYTYIGANKPPATTPSVTDVSATLLRSDNTSITNAMAGVPVTGNATADAAALANVLDWAHGVDVDDINSNNDQTDARPSLGDPLHSQPLLISYRGTNDTDATNDDITIYFGDNEGALHAVDSVTGNEIFSFTPKELLPNLNSYRNNIGDFRNRPYGLDGPITRLFNDANKDRVPLNGDGSIQAGEFIYLYVGMRRGGRNYYSLDVTCRDPSFSCATGPKLRWAIYGGSGDYAELGQTWSDAVVRKIRYKGAIKDVIIFSGGYDPDADSPIRLTDTADQGRAVYIADAVTGERLWWASLSGSNLNLSSMKFSIPASPKVVDLDADGLADRIYVADSGGQVFRFVLNRGHAAADSAAALVTDGSRIAMLSDADTAAGSRTEANARRFFAPPDVAVIEQGGGQRFLSLSIGSGFREKPNSTTIQDRFYVLRDPDDQNGPVNPLSIVESAPIPLPNPNTTGVVGLYNATANLLSEGTFVGDGTGTKEIAQASLAGSAGFFITLDNSGTFVGEKVFNESFTTAGNVLFSSFTPNVTTSACQAVAGLSKAYLISVLSGTPAMDYSDTTNPEKCGGLTSCTAADRSINLAQQGLPGDIAIIFPDSGPDVDVDGDGDIDDDDRRARASPVIYCFGAECAPLPSGIDLKKAYWLKKSD